MVLNENEPRPVPISKDFAHLMIRKIGEAYIEFHWIQWIYESRSDANAHVEVSEYTLKSKLPEVKHLSRT